MDGARFTSEGAATAARTLQGIPPGGRLGRWRVLEVLGRGGMGVVYRAECEGRTAALKVVHPQLLEKPEFVRRFQLEAEAGARIRHANVVRTFGVETAEVGGRVVHFLVMEYVHGRTLQELQVELLRVPEGLLRDLACGVARGLAAIHDAGIIHRDLKPENVLVTDRHEVKIMDLGVARLRSEEIRLSRTGQFVGSLLFASPEQLGVKASAVSPAIDQYAFGLLLWQLAAGRHPFDASTVAEVVSAHLHETPPPLSSAVPDASPFLDAVVATLLAKDPAQRFESARALADALETGEASAWWRARSALEPRAPGSGTRRPTPARPIVGRARELRDASLSWRSARQGKGAAFLVTGEAGIGKTRLVETLLEAAAGGDRTTLFGSVPRGEAESPFALVRAALLEALPDGRLDREAATRLSLPPREARGLAALLADAPSTDAAPLSTAEAAVLAADLFVSLCRERARVVVFDDLHRAGDGDREVFRHLAARVAEIPLLVVATATSPVDPALRAALAGIRGLRELCLSRLTPEEMRAVLDGLVGSRETADALAKDILPRAGGSPQVLERLVEGLHACGALERGTSGGLRLTGTALPADLPQSVHDLVARGLSRVTDEGRLVLEAASVQGPVFDVRVLAAVLSRPPLAVLETLVPLAREPRMIRGEGRERWFDPPVVQEVLWGRLDAAKRATLHAKTAEAILAQEPQGSPPSDRAAARAAGHFLLGGVPSRAAPLLMPAIDGLLLRRRHGEALELARLALAAGTEIEPGLCADVLLRRARLLELEGRREEERDSLERAIEATGAARREMPVELLEAHGRCLAALGERRRAEEVFRAHLAAAVSAGDAAAEAMAHGVLARLALDRGDLAAARAGAERSLLLARAARQPRQEASALGLLASLYERTGKPDPALAHHARRLALATRLSDARQASDAHGDLARLALHRGRLREALVHLDRQATTARDAGHRRGESRARHGFGRVALARGHLLEAVEAFREAIASARAAGSASEEAAASVDLAHATLCLGDAPKALSVLLRAMSLAARDGDAETLADARVACGLAAEHRGDGEEAASWHREVLSARLALSGPTEVHAWLGLARAAALSGRPDRAVEPLDRATAIAAARGWPSTRTTAAALRAAFVGGDASHALALLAEHGESLPWAERIEAHVALAKATGDPWHFLEARRALDAAQVDLSPEARDTMDRGFPPARAAREGAGAVGGEHR